ncbi:Clp amino terminal domain protein [compost metagenome]
MAHDPTRLLRRLNSYCTQALTAAASVCQARGHSHITVEHWLVKLLDQGEGDLVVIARRYGWDVEAIWQGLLEHFDTLPRSVPSKPKLSREVQQLITNAWLLASLDHDCEQLRSLHLLWALFETPNLLAR